ncbi:MAG: hypothetical protein Q9160_000602 [Pyrenula sp. 1 TL-2023]
MGIFLAGRRPKGNENRQVMIRVPESLNLGGRATITSMISKTAKFAVVIPVKKSKHKAIKPDRLSTLPLEITCMIFELTYWSDPDEALLRLLPIARFSRNLLSAACLFRMPRNVTVPESSIRHLEHYVRPALFRYCKFCHRCYVRGDDHDVPDKWTTELFSMRGYPDEYLLCPMRMGCPKSRDDEPLPTTPIQGRRTEARVIPPPL